MAFSIRQIYARQIAFLSIGLFLLLIISIGMAFFHEARVRVLHELGTQANMVATSIAQTPTITAEDEKKRLNHVFLNPAIQLACLKSDSGLIELHNQEGSTEDAELSCATVMQAPPVWDYLSVKAVMTDDTLPKPLGEVVLVAHSPSYIAMVIRAGIIAGLLSLIFRKESKKLLQI